MLLVIFLRRIALHTRHNSGVLLSQKTNKGKKLPVSGCSIVVQSFKT
jgi:hypothetical protein